MRPEKDKRSSSTTERTLSKALSNLIDTVTTEYEFSTSTRNLLNAVDTAPMILESRELTRPSALLATGRVLVVHPQRQPVEATVLFDTASEMSFISEKFFKTLKIPKQSWIIPLKGMGNSSGGNTKGVCVLRLQSRYSELSILTQTFIVRELTSQLPPESIEMANWPHLENLELADPSYYTSKPIDILLGAIPVSEIMLSGVIRGENGTPIGQSTIFGWIIYGSTQNRHSGEPSYCLHATTDDELHSLISKFWTQEEITESTAPKLSPEDQQCEEHFKRTHSRDETGRYIVRLPLKSSPSELGDSSAKAKKCLASILRCLENNTEYGRLYTEFMSEYEYLDHMRKAPAELSETPIYYLPHHGVLREQSKTTKLRVVFNGSSITTSRTSLNDLLHIGPKIQPDISEVLLWVRRHRVIFATDITKMFRQIKVHPDDWDLQRIFWCDEKGNIIPYQLTTVTYGTRSAPYLAVKVLHQLVEDEGEKFPLAVEPLIKGRYVDDIYGGGESISETVSSAEQLRSLCAAGGFPLAKWASNSPEVLSKIDPESKTSDVEIQEKDNSVKVLGLSWNPMTDHFQFKYSESPPSRITKRTVLSEIARLFDPLGFLVPLLVRAKMLMQELWLEKISWDQPLSTELSQNWSKFREDLTRVNIISISRWLHLTPSASIEVHGFSDASQLAMAAVVFLKVTNKAGECTSSIVCAKSQVAPLKPTTIPRLELNAAVLLTKLVSYVKRTLEIPEEKTYLWTDSSVTLTWLKAPPSRWKDYVRNRVHQVQELQPKAIWQYVAGKHNPADCASRGLSPEKLRDHSLWWHGPSWLLKSSEEWPTFKIPSISSTNLEERPGQSFCVRKAEENPFCDLLEKRSSLMTILRVTATCLRSIQRFKGRPQSSLITPLSMSDLEAAKLILIKTTQGLFFSEELRVLRKNNFLPKSSYLCKLTPYIDSKGVLRVGGRLEHAEISSEEKHPAILPRNSPLTSLVIADAHEKTLHGGTQLTLSYLRQTYWIVGGRVPVRSFILRCTNCARNRGVRAQQLMGQLPPARVNPSRAFYHCGIDYAGPFTIKTWKGRGAKTHKSWIAVFVCLVTSAVHLEIVTDYTTETFIAAYRRFISRRGICNTLYSDCGTNFLGADKILRDLFRAGTSENARLRGLLLKDGTNWKFNPPSAPHFGGKWEASVKSLKFHIKRVIGDTLLTYEELSTLLTQIEAVLNSRPLSPLSEDPTDLGALTPSHFLIGEPLNSLPEPSLLQLSQSRLSRWQLLQQKFQYFWKRWSSECMQRYQAISKWHHPSNEIKVGTMVLLTDERFPPSKWPLARVEELHPGADGYTRVVTIRTSSTTLKRPITKLCVLPITAEKETITEVAN